MNNLYLNCNEILELDDIKVGIELNDNIPDLLQNIFTNTQQERGGNIECRVLASIYKCILTENNVFTTSTPNDLPILQENQVANLYLLPINHDIEYHFITICRVGDNYIIYSVNGRDYIPHFQVNIHQFNIWYQQLIQRDPGIMDYQENINDIQIAEPWNGLTHVDLQTSFQHAIDERYNEDNDDDEDEDEQEDQWDYWKREYLNKDLSYYNPKILIFTRDESKLKKNQSELLKKQIPPAQTKKPSVGGLKRKTNKRKTNKRKTNKRKTNKRKTNKRTNKRRTNKRTLKRRRY